MNNQRYSFLEFRIIGISLAILSIGIALAWFGLFWFLENKEGSPVRQNEATISGTLK